MAIVCSSCDHEPDKAAVAGGPCASCGERLIAIADDDLIGEVVDGRFEVLSELGKGGMGVVFRAKQLSIGREVALKVLDRRIERDVGAVKRFFREAKIASALQHPNTVPIIDFGQDPTGRLYLVMELVRGHTLQREVGLVGPLALARVIAIGIQLCNALEVAHELGIVHRDLKLDNVMLLERGHVKILDFGLARSLSDPSTQMTATGLISGTPRYMPPEVAFAGAAPDPSQDIYALGVMLAELAIGRPLWVAPTLEMLFVNKVAVEESVADVPEPLRGLIARLIAEDPGHRPDAVATRRALETMGGTMGGAHVKPLQLELDAAALASDPTEILASPDPFAKLEVVALDDAVNEAPVARASVPAPPVDDPFSAPKDPVLPVALEVDPVYVAARALKRASQPPQLAVQDGPVTGVVDRPPPRRSAARMNLIVALVILGFMAIGAYWLYTHRLA